MCAIRIYLGCIEVREDEYFPENPSKQVFLFFFCFSSAALEDEPKKTFAPGIFPICSFCMQSTSTARKTVQSVRSYDGDVEFSLNTVEVARRVSKKSFPDAGACKSISFERKWTRKVDPCICGKRTLIYVHT